MSSLAPVRESAEQRPVFVYGTLRPGQPNWERLLAGRCERVAAGRLTGVELLDCGHYPAAVERPEAGDAIGDVLWVQPAAWPEVLAALDHLEGYDPADPEPLYTRVIRPVEVAGELVDCWVYVAGAQIAGSARPVVESGDWIAHCADRPGYRDRWDDIARSGGRAEAEP